MRDFWGLPRMTFVCSILKRAGLGLQKVNFSNDSGIPIACCWCLPFSWPNLGIIRTNMDSSRVRKCIQRRSL